MRNETDFSLYVMKPFFVNIRKRGKKKRTMNENREKERQINNQKFTLIEKKIERRSKQNKKKQLKLNDFIHTRTHKKLSTCNHK